jgi:hypothetical protein
MKKISILIPMFCALLFVSSCDNDNADLKVYETDSIVLSELDITDIELDQTNPNNPIVTLNWTSANYGQQTSVNYSVQASSDEAFTNPILVTTVNGNSATLSVNQLNSAVGSAGLPPFQWNTAYLRVVSTIGTTSSLPVASNTISFNAYPYFNYPFKDYYIVGDATQPGWNNNNNNPPLFRDGENPNLYRYVGYFAAGAFKVLEEKGLWQPQWGTNGGSAISVNPGGGSDPGTFPYNNTAISTAGFYAFTINYTTNTFTFEPYTATGATSYTSMTIEGSSSATTTMTQSGFDSHIWFVNTLHLTPGNLKFTSNTSTSWGGSTSFSGTGSTTISNIPVVVEDDYDIWFNDLTGHYIMIPLNL